MDWQLVVLRLRNIFGLTDSELAKKAGCSREQIRELKFGRVKEPKYTVGVGLMRLWEKADGRTRETTAELGEVPERQA